MTQLRKIKRLGFDLKAKTLKSECSLINQSSYCVMGVPFSEYIKRMEVKYKFSWLDRDKIEGSCVGKFNMSSVVVITSPKIECDKSLITFLHELGHKEGQQTESFSRFEFFGPAVNVRKFTNEILAWERAIRRFKAYGKQLTVELWTDFIVGIALKSYYNGMEDGDRGLAVELVNELADLHNMPRVKWWVNHFVEEIEIKTKVPKHHQPFWTNDWRRNKE